MSEQSERLKTISRHLKGSQGSSSGCSDVTTSQRVESTIPQQRHTLLKWNGWGYKDSKFEVDPNTLNFRFTGDRYQIGNKTLPQFRQWAESTLGVDVTNKAPSLEVADLQKLPPPKINDRFLEELRGKKMKYSLDGMDRLFRAHGHTLQEMVALREGSFSRIPDLVVWPTCHEDVVILVDMACSNDVVIIPFGGGTTVSGAVTCPANEDRMIVSLDTSQMNKLLWVDHQNLTAKFEGGIVGQDLERTLAKYDLCTGHEPDSFEFSSLGGWVATRASGMKKNIYGNIEDLVVHIKFVTPIGVVERNCQVPRLSTGPDVHQFILGSEGTLGVVTEVVIKVRPVPECRKYGSLVFPNFKSGYEFMRAVAAKRLKPASVRLMDNEQFIFGQALKPEAESLWKSFVDSFKRIYLTKIKGFSVKDICVATLLFEGTKEECESLEKKVLQLGTEFGGISAGEENGKRGYLLTYVIAYIRDIALDYRVLSESFETSVPWDRGLDLCYAVKHTIHSQLKAHSITMPALISCRVTQTYDAGCCIYFYFGFNYSNCNNVDVVEIYEAIENAARDEIIACGGSLSHHHGVGKIRKRWLKDSVSETGLGMMRAIKSYVDPKNNFANGNLMQE